MNIFDIVEEEKSNLSASKFNKLWDVVTAKDTRTVLRQIAINLEDRDPNGNEFDKVDIQNAIKQSCMVQGFNYDSYKDSKSVLISVKVIYEQALMLKTPDQVFDNFSTMFKDLEGIFDK